MNTFSIYIIAGAALIALGSYALVHCQNLIRKILALNIMSNGIFMFFIVTAERNATTVPDPVPHAMVLTGIVVAVCATAFALALAERVRDVTGELTLTSKFDTDGN